jgi:hypothetical protein
MDANICRRGQDCRRRVREKRTVLITEDEEVTDYEKKKKTGWRGRGRWRKKELKEEKGKERRD